MKNSFPFKSFELALATPQIMAIRMMRMSTTSFPPSASDTQEFNRMWTEKMEAFGESWSEMAKEVFRQQHKMLKPYMENPLAPWTSLGFHNHPLHQTGEAGHQVLNKGLAPVHRVAMDNAKRLTK